MSQVDLLHALFASRLSVALAATDPAGKLLGFNAAAARLFGLNDDMRGSADPALFAWEGASADALAQEIQDALKHGETCAVRRYRRADGLSVSWLETRLVPMHDVNGKHIGFL